MLLGCVGRVRITQPLLPAYVALNTTFADAKLFRGDDEDSSEDVDQDATVETFMLVAGVSSIVFGVTFNVPFVVAPSVLYASREVGYVCAAKCREVVHYQFVYMQVDISSYIAQRPY